MIDLGRCAAPPAHRLAARAAASLPLAIFKAARTCICQDHFCTMSACNDPPQLPNLHAFLHLMKTRQASDKKEVIEEFPKFMVRCFLASTGTSHAQPFQDNKFMQRFPLTKESWDLLECLDCFPDSRCRCALVLTYHINLYRARNNARAIPDSLFYTATRCKVLSLRTSRGTIHSALSSPVLPNLLSKSTLNRRTCQPWIFSL